MSSRLSPPALVSSPAAPSTAARQPTGEPDARREAEIADVVADLDLVQRRIVARKREIAQCWSGASTADRLLAVDRLLRDGNLSAAQVADIAALQTRVRAAFHAARAERKRLSDNGVPAGTLAASLARLEADVVRCEAERDRVIGLAKLTEELWRTSESFVLPAAISTRLGPFREMLAFEAKLEHRLLHLQRAPSQSVFFLPAVEEDEPVAAPQPSTPAPRPEPSAPRRPLHHRLLQLLHSPAAAAAGV